MSFGDLVKPYLERIPQPPALKRAIHIGRILIADLIRCDLIKQAYAMAYVTLLSLVPSLAAVTCVAALFSPMLGPDSVLFEKIRGYFLENLAAGSGEMVIAKLEEIMARIDFSSVGLTSFAAMMVTLVLLLKQIEEALNRVWLVRKARNMFTRVMYFWTFLTLGIVVIGLILSVSGFSLDSLLSLTDDVPGGRGILSSLSAWLAGFVFFFFLYKVAPNTNVRTRNAAIGAAIASLCLQQAGNLYGLYVSDYNNYQSLYGVMAALPLFLMWIYICWLIILMGAVISWRLQQGIPQDEKEDTLDAARLPQERQRNLQVRTMMPVVALLAIHKKFASGEGVGLTASDLADQLKLPVGWLGDALDTLEAMGYVVRTQKKSAGMDVGDTEEAYFPAAPAPSVKLKDLFAALDQPLDEWVEHWHHDLPLDIGGLMTGWSGDKRARMMQLDMSQALDQLGKAPAS